MSAQSAREFLLGVADAVESGRSGWTKRALGRDASGKSVGYSSVNACQWCALGFIASQIEGTPAEDEVRAALKKAGNRDIIEHNDSLKSAADFVAWFRRAAELCT